MGRRRQTIPQQAAVRSNQRQGPILDAAYSISPQWRRVACNVIVGDRAVAACDTPLWSVADKDITTIEGLGTEHEPHPLQRAFIAEQALQCGYCVPGILMSAAALLMRNPKPTGEDVRASLDRNLCRCGSHNRMVRAVLRAAAEIEAR